MHGKNTQEPCKTPNIYTCTSIQAAIGLFELSAFTWLVLRSLSNGIIPNRLTNSQNRSFNLEELLHQDYRLSLPCIGEDPKQTKGDVKQNFPAQFCFGRKVSKTNAQKRHEKPVSPFFLKLPTASGA